MIVQVAYVFIVLVWWLLFPYNFREWVSSLLAVLRTRTMQCAHNIVTDTSYIMQQQQSSRRNNEPMVIDEKPRSAIRKGGGAKGGGK